MVLDGAIVAIIARLLIVGVYATTGGVTVVACAGIVVITRIGVVGALTAPGHRTGMVGAFIAVVAVHRISRVAGSKRARVAGSAVISVITGLLVVFIQTA